MASDLNATSAALLSCVCDALTSAERPVCDCYATIGAPVMDRCCECDPGVSGEAIISFERLYEADPETLTQVDRVRPCKGGVKVAEFSMMVTRCFPTIEDRGLAPLPAEQDAAAFDLNIDVEIVWHALTCCTDTPLRVREVVVDSDPEGGCSALSARVAIQVAPARHEVIGS